MPLEPERAGPRPTPRVRRSLLLLVGVWAVWAASLLTFQEVVVARLEADRPDRVLGWTARHTTVDRFEGRPYLADPALNTHVSFDSEYYISIAVAGYDDVRVASFDPPDGPSLSANHAFMPLYPFSMRVVAAPLTWLGMGPIAAVTLAGVAISLLSTLAAMVALYSLARRHLGEAGGLRAAIYLLIFPTGFFLAQVYTEGLFLALAFGSLALMADRKPIPAGLLAVAAVLTRAVGVALVLPLALGCLQAFLEMRRGGAETPISRKELASWAGAALAPVVTYLLWSSSALGRAFDTVQRELTARGTLNLDVAWAGWWRAISGWPEARSETQVYYALEVAAVVLGVAACGWAMRRWPGPALFGLAAIGIAITSGPAQGMIRYALAAPAIFLLLAHLGRQWIFDRGWTIASVLLMGLLAALFSLDFWVA